MKISLSNNKTGLTKIQIDGSLSNENIKELFEKSHENSNLIASSKKITFDLTRCGFVAPSGIALLAGLTDEIREKGIGVSFLIIPDSNVAKFLRAIGFLKNPEKIASFYEKNMANFAVKLRLAKNTSASLDVANEIFKHLLHRGICTENSSAAINWAMWEIFDNAGVHGYQCYDADVYPKPVYICAFSYKNKVEVAVMDRGQGIYASLKPKFGSINQNNILEKSLEKGVSGHPNGSPGFGLYGSKELALSGGGELFIWSSSRGLKVSEKNIINFNCLGTIGTLVVFSMAQGAEPDFNRIINKSAQDSFDDLNLDF